MHKIPKAKKVKKVYKKHGDLRIDNYSWLRDDTRKNKEVLDYLKAERAYHDGWIKTQSNISKNYFKKLNGYIPPKDESLKVERDGFFYFSESLKKNEYRKFYRSKKKNSKKELLHLKYPVPITGLVLIEQKMQISTFITIVLRLEMI